MHVLKEKWTRANQIIIADLDGDKRPDIAATAERVSYTQSKEQFILEGNNRVPATLSHRDPQSGQQIDNSAGKIIFNRLTGQAEWDTVRAFELTPGTGTGKALENAFGTPPRRQ
jgi:hypothetical protein